MTRIKQDTVCSFDNKTLSDEDIFRDYQYGKDKYVVVTNEDLEKIKKESTEAIDVVKMAQDPQIPPTYYSDPHYLVSDGKIGVEAFALNNIRENISPSKVVPALAFVKESPAAEPDLDIAGWIFKVLIIIGLALVVYSTFTGRLFQPIFHAAKSAHWSKLVVRPSLW